MNALPITHDLMHQAQVLHIMVGELSQPKESDLRSAMKANVSTPPKQGEVLEGTVLSKQNRALYIDLGAFGTGIVFGVEYRLGREAIKHLNPGDVVSVKVADIENEDGFVELSLKDLGQRKEWETLEERKNANETVLVKIMAANKGGLLVSVNGVNGFLPVSRLTPEHYPRVDGGDKGKILQELQKFVGQDMEVKIIDLNPKEERLIVSEKEIFEEQLKERLTEYNVGDVIEGTVTAVVDFGAFVKFKNNPDIEGLIHISELSWGLIDNPNELLKPGDHVNAKIIDIQNNKVSLSLKALQEDPWMNIEKKYPAGTTINGEVFKFTPYGAFIRVDENIYGLIHVSKFGDIQTMREILKDKTTYQFVIESVNPQDKRLMLTLKDLDEKLESLGKKKEGAKEHKKEVKEEAGDTQEEAKESKDREEQESQSGVPDEDAE
ncbi:MAG: S1 RNA-binding domain-containing protein [Patescibacteria group bacterium]|nr:S1 RNA-binding domain-containing protein [Patescibacteria group bacterium]MDE2438403.1 S1 RNA-binding domain-containing protein [Patescibacteria group bacterium]